MSPSRFAVFAAVGLAPFLVACGRDSQAAGQERAEPPTVEPPRADCRHAACGKDFFVDAAPAGLCAVGDACSVGLTLAARGDFHINDDYPYKFKADDAPGVEFLGTGDAGKNVFSKVGKNWTKTGEKTGAMTVTFKPSDGGSKVIAGVFKFSVCSPQNCELEQQPVKASVTVHDTPH
jgi:hypothetical protein